MIFGALGQFALGQFSQTGNAAGATLTVGASLIGGAAAGAAHVNGQVLSDTSTIAVSGAAAGSANVAGQILSDTTALIEGAATGAAAGPGDLVSVGVSIISGGATANHNAVGDGSIGWWGPPARIGPWPAIVAHGEARGAVLCVVWRLLPGMAHGDPREVPRFFAEELAILAEILDLDLQEAA